MGVPKFFAWLMKNYKHQKFIFTKEIIKNIDEQIIKNIDEQIIKTSNEQIIKNIDWFLIDTNCLIHPTCFKILAEESEKPNINFKNLENKMINAVIDYI